MLNRAILEVGLAVEIAKHKVPEYTEKAVTWLEETADKIDDKYSTPYPCSGDFMCLREGVRHKANCPGKTKPINKYLKELKKC